MKTDVLHTTPNGCLVYRIENAAGNLVELSSLGAGITKIMVPDANGIKDDVVLGYSNYADYMDDDPCAGKTPGRFANRIAKGRFVIDGKVYRLDTNNGPNALHGGRRGFHNAIWKSDLCHDGSVRFTYHSADGEEGYPGEMDVTVKYSWNDRDELMIEYKAVTSKPTIVNLTNHAYFNLSGENSGSCLGHIIKLNCHRWLPPDATDIPLGRIELVAGSPMDFTSPKSLGADIYEDFYNLLSGKGYNHFFLIDDWENDGSILHAATLLDLRSGRRLDVSTTQCGLVLYTGNWLSGKSPVGKNGRRYVDHDGVAIECQGTPDAPNHSNFPSQILRPGEEYYHRISYRFSVVKL